MKKIDNYNYNYNYLYGKLRITITITFTIMAKCQLQSQLQLGSLTNKKQISENDILGKICDIWNDILRCHEKERFS